MSASHRRPASPEAQALLRVAERDWKTATLLMQHPDAPISSICFHAQQYVEKVLKAVLVSHAVVFRRTHDLRELADLCIQHGLTLPLPSEQLSRLNPCAVLLRYQGLDADMGLTMDIDEIQILLQATRAWLEEQLFT